MLPVGIDDFRKIRNGNYYYVDKTALIEELLEAGGEVSLFTRPRRFRKTLANSGLWERLFRFKGNQPFPAKRERILKTDSLFSA